VLSKLPFLFLIRLLPFCR